MNTVTINKEYIGSDFDDFLKEEGMLEHCQAVAVKRVLAFQLQQFMEENKFSKTEMATRMHTSRAALDRLLNPNNTAITLDSMIKVACLIGKQLNISFTSGTTAA